MPDPLTGAAVPARTDRNNARVAPGRLLERYCVHLEDLRQRLGEDSLSATEERIFSREGTETWREYVKTHWKPISRDRRSPARSRDD